MTRFTQLQNAYWRMIGRCEANRRAGNLTRASRQFLAASRLFKLMLNQ